LLTISLEKNKSTILCLKLRNEPGKEIVIIRRLNREGYFAALDQAGRSSEMIYRPVKGDIEIYDIELFAVKVQPTFE
jgi:hypothetical protein